MIYERDMIYCAERLDFLRFLPRASCRLAIIDPPYNMKKAPWDAWPNAASYDQWLDETFDALLPALTADATLYIFNKPANLARLLGRLQARGLTLLNWIAWDKRDGMGNTQRRYAPRSEHLLFMAVGGDYVFNIDEARQPYESSERIRHAMKSGIIKNGKRWFPNEKGRQRGDVWHFPSERHSLKSNGRVIQLKHPTKKPSALIDMLVRVSSEPGDTVLDPFVGLGTTARAALDNRRHFFACDSEIEYVSVARDLLQILHQHP